MAGSNGYVLLNMVSASRLSSDNFECLRLDYECVHLLLLLLNCAPYLPSHPCPGG